MSFNCAQATQRLRGRLVSARDCPFMIGCFWHGSGTLVSRTPYYPLFRSYGRTVQNRRVLVTCWPMFQARRPASVAGYGGGSSLGSSRALGSGSLWPQPCDGSPGVWCRGTRVMIRVPGCAVRGPLALVMGTGRREGS